jgi:transposase-like protein
LKISSKKINLRTNTGGRKMTEMIDYYKEEMANVEETQDNNSKAAQEKIKNLMKTPACVFCYSLNIERRRQFVYGTLLDQVDCLDCKRYYSIRLNLKNDTCEVTEAEKSWIDTWNTYETPEEEMANDEETQNKDHLTEEEIAAYEELSLKMAAVFYKTHIIPVCYYCESSELMIRRQITEEGSLDQVVCSDCKKHYSVRNYYNTGEHLVNETEESWIDSLNQE